MDQVFGRKSGGPGPNASCLVPPATHFAGGAPHEPEHANLLTVAAEMRAVGHPWAAVAAQVHRKPESCQKWPNRFREEWAELFREAQRKRFDETSSEAHTVLKILLRSQEDRTRLKAVEVWLRCGAAAYGLQGQMVTPDPGEGEPEDDFCKASYRRMVEARRRIDARRARKGLPPATDDEFIDEYERELGTVLNPNPIQVSFDADGNALHGPPDGGGAGDPGRGPRSRQVGSETSPGAAAEALRPSARPGKTVLGAALVLVGLLVGGAANPPAGQWPLVQDASWG